MRQLYLIILLLGVSPALRAEEARGSGNLEHVMNAFLATFAKTNPAWMKEIMVLRGDNKPLPGMQLGRSPVVGDFAFIPKTWEDLTDAQKRAVQSDRRLKAYLVSIRNAEIYPAITNAKIRPEDTPISIAAEEDSTIKIDPSEMLRRRPLMISTQ